MSIVIKNAAALLTMNPLQPQLSGGFVVIDQDRISERWRQVRTSVHRAWAPVNKCKKRGHGRRRSEVGATHSSVEAWYCRWSEGVAV